MESNVAEIMDALGDEVAWLHEEDPDRLEEIRFEWEGGDPDFGRLLVEDIESVWDAVRDFLHGAGPNDFFPSAVRRFDLATGEISEWQTDKPMKDAQRAFQALVSGSDLESLRAKVDSSWQVASELLRSWARQESVPLAEWGKVQRSWREALGLPGKEAAALLGVSAPTVTRYEKGERIPSLAYVESMVERMIEAGTSPTASTNALLTSLDVLGVEMSEIIEQLEPSYEDEAAIRDHLQETSERLPIEDVEILLRIAKQPAAIEAIRVLPATDPLSALREAVTDQGTRR